MTDSSPAQTRGAVSPAALLVAGAFFMEFIDGTVIATALPDMAKTFGVEAVALNIGISAYLITLAVLIPASAGSPIASARAPSLPWRWPSSPSPRCCAASPRVSRCLWRCAFCRGWGAR